MDLLRINLVRPTSDHAQRTTLMDVGNAVDIIYYDFRKTFDSTF